MQSPRSFSHVETWIFDLDNTLYPPSCGLFAQIDERMMTFIADRCGIAPAEARVLQKNYYRQYGTSLRGLMDEHDIDPHEFMDFVHDISRESLIPDAAMREAIAALPGKRYILTNGSRAHAENCTSALGIQDLFHDIFDVTQANFVPKPNRSTYDSFIAHLGVKAPESAMFEDLARNLEVPHALGMTTVLVLPNGGDVPERMMHDDDAIQGPYVDHVTNDLPAFLAGLGSAR